MHSFAFTLESADVNSFKIFTRFLSNLCRFTVNVPVLTGVIKPDVYSLHKTSQNHHVQLSSLLTLTITVESVQVAQTYKTITTQEISRKYCTTLGVC